MVEFLVREPHLGYLSEDLWCPKSAINVEGVKRALTFQFQDQNGVTVLTLWSETEHHLLVPREFWAPQDYLFPVIDLRPAGFTRTNITSRVKLDHLYEGGELRPTGKTRQLAAMNALLAARGGVLQLACGVGKTVLALDFAARLDVPTIIAVDTAVLLRQWKEEIALHLDVRPENVGLIQGSTFDWKKPIVLATYHALAARAVSMPEEVRRWFGLFVAEEGHHLSAPTFSRAANLFYGTRLALTATPKRDDGLNVIYDAHVGPVIHKDLAQDLTPRIIFHWTGFGLDEHDEKVQAATRDTNGELHIGKIAGFLGAHRPRIDFLVQQIRYATEDGRKVLVLSKSVDSLVNLLAAWNNEPLLLTDLPFPTAEDVGEVIPPVECDPPQLARLGKAFGICTGKLKGYEGAGDTVRAQAEALKRDNIVRALEAHRVFKKCESMWEKKRKAYLAALLAKDGTAGLMIYRVKAELQQKMLREKQVTFAIMKYGREGLNERKLDTVMVIEPLSSKNTLQQLLGRILRAKEGKRAPIAVFYEDDVGPLIGMCTKLRKHMRDWPADEGGALAFEILGRPKNKEEPWKRNGDMKTLLRGPTP